MGYPGEIRSIAGTGQMAICHHEDCANPSQWRVQGETDSFGAEYEYFCADHIEDIKAELKQDAYREDHCEGCNKLAVLRPTRDWEEGNNGPLYHWCAECRDRNRRNLDDLRNMDDPYPDEEDVDTLGDIMEDDHDILEERIEAFTNGNTLSRNELKELDVFAHEFKGFEVTRIELPCDGIIAISGMCGRYHTEATISIPRTHKYNVRLVTFAVKPIPEEGHPALPHDVVEIGLHLMDKLGRYGYDFKLINYVKFFVPQPVNDGLSFGHHLWRATPDDFIK